MGTTRQATRHRPARQDVDETFDELVRRHTDAVWRFALGMLRDPADAEEVVQDTFVRVHRGLDSWRGEAALRTWILAIARNLCIDRLRGRRHDTVPLDDAEAERLPLGTARPDHAERATLRTLLTEAAAALPDDEREAFHLVDVLGFTGVEAAAIVGVPESTLRSRLYRAHRSLVAHVLEEDER